jgi:hypothetical protein
MAANGQDHICDSVGDDKEGTSSFFATGFERAAVDELSLFLVLPKGADEAQSRRAFWRTLAKFYAFGRMEPHPGIEQAVLDGTPWEHTTHEGKFEFQRECTDSLGEGGSRQEVCLLSFAFHSARGLPGNKTQLDGGQ